MIDVPSLHPLGEVGSETECATRCAEAGYPAASVFQGPPKVRTAPDCGGHVDYLAVLSPSLLMDLQGCHCAEAIEGFQHDPQYKSACLEKCFENIHGERCS